MVCVGVGETLGMDEEQKSLRTLSSLSDSAHSDNAAGRRRWASRSSVGEHYRDPLAQRMSNWRLVNAGPGRTTALGSTRPADAGESGKLGS